MKRKQMNKQNIKKNEDLTDKLENHIREPKSLIFRAWLLRRSRLCGYGGQ